MELMNKIIRDNYPAADLPADLREGLTADEMVRVTIEPKPPSDENATMKRRQLLAELYGQAKPSFSDLNEIADHIRAIRQAWD